MVVVHHDPVIVAIIDDTTVGDVSQVRVDICGITFVRCLFETETRPEPRLDTSCPAPPPLPPAPFWMSPAFATLLTPARTLERRELLKETRPEP